MRLSRLALLAFVPMVMHAQSANNADSLRNKSAESAAADPLHGDPNKLAPLSVQARRVQDEFERNHRIGLRFYNGGALARCEVQIGTLCYWNNNGDVPPPAERNDARIEREQLLDALRKAHAADRSDDWVNGMLVRYAIESEKNDLAIQTATSCRGTVWWCHALEGLARHVDNQHVAAAAAFDKALEAMPATQRCQWTSLVTWLDTLSQPAYREKGCNERSATDAYILRMAQPLWMLPTNDLRNELLARWTISRVHSLGRIPYDMGWSDAIQIMQVRFGWPTAWSVQNGGVADPRPPSVTGHEPTPSYDFMPSAKTLETPLAAMPNGWEPNRKQARMRYSPRYASGFAELPHQFARFLRGDTTVVAGGYRLVRELEMGRAPYSAALIIDSAPGANTNPLMVRKDSAAANGAIIARLGKSPAVASLEVLAPAGKRAARVRTALTPLQSGTTLSDFLVLQRADESNTPSLELAAQNAYGSLDFKPGATVGMYWEVYRNVSPSAPLQVSVRATRLNSSFMQRFSSSLGLSKAITPISISFADNGRADGKFGRTLAVVFPQVPPGEYQLSLIVRGAGKTDSTSQVIRMIGDDR